MNKVLLTIIALVFLVFSAVSVALGVCPDTCATKLIAGKFYEFEHNNLTKLIYRGSGVVQYGWDYDDRLVSVTKPGVAASYVYNPDNIRVGATVNGVATQYLVDPNMDYASVLEERSGATLNSRYVHGGDLLSQTNGSSTDFLHYDVPGGTHLGTVKIQCWC